MSGRWGGARLAKCRQRGRVVICASTQTLPLLHDDVWPPKHAGLGVRLPEVKVLLDYVVLRAGALSVNALASHSLQAHLSMLAGACAADTTTAGGRARPTLCWPAGVLLLGAARER